MSTDRFLINAYMVRQVADLAEQIKQINSILAEAFKVLPPGTIDPVAGVRTLVRDKRILDWLEKHGLPRSLMKCGGLNERTEWYACFDDKHGSFSYTDNTLRDLMDFAMGLPCPRRVTMDDFFPPQPAARLATEHDEEVW